MIAVSAGGALIEGLAHHVDGRLEDAARFYGAVLERDSRNSDAWHLLGRVWLGKGDFESAASCVTQAIRLRPDLPAFPATLGDILVAQGRGQQAVSCYQEALRLDPRFVPALVNLGNVLQSQGLRLEACGAYARAIEADPSSAEAFSNLGNALSALGRPDEALACFQEALRLHPDHPASLVNLSALWLSQQREKEAEECLRRALEVRPGMTQALSNLATALLEQQRYDEAEASARQALAQAPEAADLHANLASVLLHQQRWEEAEQECLRTFQLHPGHSAARLNRGVILMSMGRMEEAAAQLHELLDAQPHSAGAWTNLGAVRAAEGRHDAARFCFEEAMRHQPDYPKAHFCHSLELLGRGELAEGFAEYDWRWKVARANRANSRQAWDGGPLEGRTIFLYAEQGLGDTIQFARYIPLIAARGGRVVVESQSAAAGIVRTVSGVAQVVLPDDPLPEFDVQAAMLSLPRIFGTTLESIPNGTRYVSFDRDLAAQMVVRLGARHGLRVGLAWAGNPQNGGDHRRSMPLSAMSPLRLAAGVEWFSLHVGPKAREDVSASGGWIHEVLSETGGLPELAALMSCLDLIITVDTMPAHLAGALGQPVWNLLCAAPDWRWLREGERTQWYPSMRLFRQTAPGDWNAVVERVSNELSNFSIQAPARTPDT